MRAVVQRVKEAFVSIDGRLVASTGPGLLVLIGFHKDDTEKDSDYIISKITSLRIFGDSEGNMNLSVSDTGGGILVVSQFTLYGDARRGRRPSFSDAMPPTEAAIFYDAFIKKFRSEYGKIESGVFGADMDVSLVNAGPVTIMLDSTRGF
ncbi:MAG TPA: D-aminoacyl-tRNA deacylase [Spirochaetota bacterium]|nr:D-aminoacyl-tRNA deacylase [Spirochaetota bacterium]